MDDYFDVSWFNLANYERFKNMTTREWAYEINIREQMNESLSNGVIASGQYIEEFVSRLQGKTDELDRAFIDHLNKTSVDQIKTKPGRTASIRPVHFFDIWQIRYFFKDIVKRYWLACKRVQQLDMSKEFDIAFSNIDDVAPTDGRALLMINLGASDGQIKADFAKWLEHARQKTKVKSPKQVFYQKDFDKWFQNRYIPYIDITIITKLQQKKITYHQIASIIFPDEYYVDRTERVRKVTAKNAEWLINNNISTVLHLQADYEEAKNFPE